MTLSVTDGAKITRHGTLAGPLNYIQSYLGLYVFGHNIADIAGGSVDWAIGADHSTVNITGGTIGSAIGFIGGVTANYRSTVNISGGDVGNIDGFGTSKVNISGGSVGFIQAWESSKINVSGGTVKGLAGVSGSSITFSGGTIASNSISLLHASTATFLGSDLSFALAGTGSDGFNTYTIYSLFGQLSDGQSLAGYSVFDYSNAGHFSGGADSLTFRAGGIIVGAPEPGSLLLLVPGLLALAAKKAARHRRAA
jgi:hypothetical protein